MSIGRNPSVSSGVVAEPVEATTIGSGALPDDTTARRRWEASRSGGR